MEVVCPAAGGGYWDTSLPNYAPLPLGWSVSDLKGDGNIEVVSSQVAPGAHASPPVYWYEIYRFPEGLPRDVSSDFPSFYREALLPQFSAMEILVSPPPTSDVRPARWAAYERLALRFIRLKYERRILGKKTSGLEEALDWVKSPYIDVQGLGVYTLGEIPGPQSVAALRGLGAKTKDLGICVAVTNALHADGAISDEEQAKGTQKCDTLKPRQPCLLQRGCVATAKQ